MQIVIQSLLALGIKLLTSSVIEKVVLLGLRELAKKTDNEVDDELVQIVEEAIKKPPQEIPERASR
jgi:hypothetical protein